MIKLKVTIQSTTATRTLLQLHGKIVNPQGLLTAIGSQLTESTRLRFRDSQAPDGSTWDPLSPVTISRRRQSSRQPLVDTGRLRNSITFLVNGNMVSIGTNVIYAPTQQFGARRGQYGRYATRRRTSIPIPWGEVPARPFLGISAEDERAILNLIKANLF